MSYGGYGSYYEGWVVHLLMAKKDVWYSGYKDVRFDFNSQATCRYKNGGHGRCDLVVHAYMPEKPQSGSYYNFEIKSGKRDLFSDKGLNLFSMYNYLVYPHSQITILPDALTYEIVEQRLKEIGGDHVGIIALVSDTDIVIERQAHRYYGDGMPPDIKGHSFLT